MATPNYDVNYDDKRFTEVESDKTAALDEVDVTFGDMISNSDKFYQNQIDAAKDYADTQAKNQQAQTDFAIEKIEQQKDQANKSYIREQAGAWADYQKQIDPYGVEAEKMANMGMTGTGYSESANTRAYITYQNRVVAARESYNQAVLNYDNAIKEAQIQNNTILAEIAYNALQTELELALQGFQYKNTLIIEQANKKLELDKYYYTKYQDVLTQINTENAMAEEVRQYNENLKQQQAELKLAQDQFDWQKDQASKSATITKTTNKTSQSGSTIKIDSNQTSKVDGNKSVNTGKAVSDTAKEKSSATIDMDSVLALGYGPISPAKLNELVNMGVIEQYTDGNKIKFRKVFKR